MFSFVRTSMPAEYNFKDIRFACNAKRMTFWWTSTFCIFLWTSTFGGILLFSSNSIENVE